MDQRVCRFLTGWSCSHSSCSVIYSCALRNGMCSWSCFAGCVYALIIGLHACFKLCGKLPRPLAHRHSWRNKGWGDNISFHNSSHLLCSKVWSWYFFLYDMSAFIYKIYKAFKNLLLHGSPAYFSEMSVLSLWSDRKWDWRAKFGWVPVNWKHMYLILEVLTK